MRRADRGISLILEILLGLGLFALGLLLVMGLFPTTFAAGAQARNLSLATNLARQVCEETRASGFGGAVSSGPTTTSLTCEVNGVQAVQEFTYQVEVQTLSSPSVKNLVVSVNWNSGGSSVGGHQHRYRLQTYLAPH